jgi:cytochrome c-type biogenesis protein CcmH/NrfG
MKSESIAYGVAGMMFGLLAGWIIGSQQAVLRPGVQAPAAQVAARPADAPNAPRPAVLDNAKVTAFRTIADKEPSNAEARVQLANLYFDAEKYDDAIKWYAEALKLTPNDVNVSTDLGVCFYYTNQADKALEQFKHSLALDPKHAKTLLNIGIVKAFGKQDLEGAMVAWQQVIEIAPGSDEAQKAKQVLDSIKSAHPGTGQQKPGD